jgi:dihydrofolate reductase
MEARMGKVTVSTFVTLDGVMQDPGGVGEFDRGGWQIQFFDDRAGAIAKEDLFAADALLLGRITYEHFAAAWPEMTDEEGYADRMNSIPKYVASTTLSGAHWNATVIKGDVPSEVAKLKEQHDLLVMGSGQLVQTLREHGLVDEYEIWIHPIVLGAGKRLFPEGPDTAKLRLTDTKSTDTGISILAYAVDHAEADTAA